MTRITPLIICGGNGTRLWPLSRRQAPKQFQRLGGPDSLTFFQSAVQRHRGEAYADPIIVTGAMHEGTVRSQLRDIQVRARIICEPMGRNTGPAVLAACEALIDAEPDAVFVVIPADHVIEGDMTTPMAACVPAALDGRIVTFGIPPRYAESGFGYIVDKGPVGNGETPLREVGQFVEKPAMDEAQRLIDTGGAYWASGLSMFSAETLISEYERIDPDTVRHVRDAVKGGSRSGNTLHLAGASFSLAASEPTEGLIFEKTDRIALAPLNVNWDDVGSWKAMHSVGEADADGNVLQGDVIALNSRNSLVRADSRLVSIVGLDNVVVVETADALLVAHIDESQMIKDVVNRLKETDRSEALRHADAPSPKMVEAPASEVTRAVGSEMAGDNFRLGTSEIDVGQALMMDRGPRTHQAIVVSGKVRATGMGWIKEVGAGGRIYADDLGRVEMRNLSDKPAELLFVTLGAVSTPPTTLRPVVEPGKASVDQLPKVAYG